MQIGEGCKLQKVKSFCGEKQETEKKNIKTHEKYKFIDFLINILW